LPRVEVLSFALAFAPKFPSGSAGNCDRGFAFAFGLLTAGLALLDG
jgi:hypothetical protein